MCVHVRVTRWCQVHLHTNSRIYAPAAADFSARTSQLDVQQQSMQTQVKILQEELSKSTMRYNQLEGVKQMGDRKLAKYEEQLRDARNEVCNTLTALPPPLRLAIRLSKRLRATKKYHCQISTRFIMIIY